MQLLTTHKISYLLLVIKNQLYWNRTSYLTLVGVSLPMDYQLSDPPVCASLIGMGGVE
jgi:hypothetical protein